MTRTHALRRRAPGRAAATFALAAAHALIAFASSRSHAATIPSASPAGALAEVRAALERRREAVRAVRAEVVVGVDAPAWAAAGTCEGLLAARRPGSLRLAGYAALATLFDTATDGRRFWVHLPGAATVYTGAAGQESLLTTLPVPPGQIVSAVFGEPYGAFDSTLAVERDGGRARLSWDVGGGRSVEAHAALGPFRIERAELRRGERVEATIHYRDYRKRDGVWWPTRIEFAWPAERTELVLDFRSVTFNPGVEDALFTIAVPEGSRVVDVAEELP